MKIYLKTNETIMIGEMVSGFTFSHEAYGEKFYLVNLSINRLSGKADIIPCMLSERLLDVTQDYRGRIVEAIGQFRSYNCYEGSKRHLELSVFVRELNFLEEFTDCTKTNQIYLDGYICKEAIYRKTPLGREIADILLAVNRPYGKSDYIPCIAWGRNARYASGFAVGARVKVWGRIQSRKYQKQISEKEYETRTAYEVSISQMEVIGSEEHKDQVADAE